MDLPAPTHSPQWERGSSANTPLDREVSPPDSTNDLADPPALPPTIATPGVRSSLAVSPEILYLPFSSLSEPLRATIKVVNQAHHKLRLQVRTANVSPDLTAVRQHENVLQPGGSDQIVVTLRKRDWSRFNTTVVVATHDKQERRIPVFAYPVMEAFTLAPQVDLGRVILAQEKRLVIPLRSKAPVAFSFQINVQRMQPKDCWSIEPRSGTLAGDRGADVVVSFSPTQPHTCELVFQVTTSQFNFEPRQCAVFGLGALPDPRKMLAERLDAEGLSSTAARGTRAAAAVSNAGVSHVDVPRKRAAPVTSVATSEAADTNRDTPTAADLENGGVSDQFAAFNAELRRVREFEQQKELRQFVCVGMSADELAAYRPPVAPAAEPPNVFSVTECVVSDVRVDTVVETAGPSAAASAPSSLAVDAVEAPETPHTRLPAEPWHDAYPLQSRLVRAIWSVIVHRRIQRRVDALKAAMASGGSPISSGDSPLAGTKGRSAKADALSVPALQDGTIPREPPKPSVPWTALVDELERLHPAEMKPVLAATRNTPTLAQAAETELAPLSQLVAIPAAYAHIDATWALVPPLEFYTDLALRYGAGGRDADPLAAAKLGLVTRSLVPFPALEDLEADETLACAVTGAPPNWESRLSAAGSALIHEAIYGCTGSAGAHLRTPAAFAGDTEDSYEYALRVQPDSLVQAALEQHFSSRSGGLCSAVGYMSEHWMPSVVSRASTAAAAGPSGGRLSSQIVSTPL